MLVEKNENSLRAIGTEVRKGEGPVVMPGNGESTLVYSLPPRMSFWPSNADLLPT